MSRLFWPLLLLAACTQTPEPVPLTDAGPSSMTRVLFIGNSYTYQNSLPPMLEAFSQVLSPATPLHTESTLVGGATLRWHQTQGPAPQLIREGNWSYVILQEQSQLGGMRLDGNIYMADPEMMFFPAARQLSAQITAAGAKPLFYMTWSRKPELDEQGHLTQAYARIASELGARLAPVGAAWERARRERPELELYDADGSHPGPAGTYLSACVLFASIFRKPCIGAPNAITGGPWTGSLFDSSRSMPLVSLPQDTAGYLQRVGSEVALLQQLRLHPDTDPTPVHPPLPSLPPGEPLQPSQLAGDWSGSLAFYPVEESMTPATLRLSLRASGTGMTGSARLTFSQAGSAESSITPLVQGSEVSFDISDSGYLKSTVHFRAVLKSGALQGTAFTEDPEGHPWYGTWTAPRAGP
jgi:hypothetical protein